MRIRHLIALLAMAVMVTSCGFLPKKEDIQQAADEAIASPASWSTEAEQTEANSIQWLASFNDSGLLKLIAEGKANNINLQVTAATRDKAKLLAKQAGAALKPSANVSLDKSFSAKANGEGPSSHNFGAGLNTSWEWDAWGGLQAGIDAAIANAEATESDYVDAEHSLGANIAKTYFQIIETKQQADVTRKNLSILTETMRVTQVKYDNGVSSGQDIALNKANLAAAQDQLIQIEGGLRDTLRSLEVLLGRYPNATLKTPDALPGLPLSPAAGMPSEILERRPDIISAERKIAAAFNATAQAKVARLPKFSLTGQFNGASTSLLNVLNPANVIWQLASNIAAPLMDGGKLKIDIEIANVEQKQAISNYAQVALTAFSDVETNLNQGLVLAKRETALSEVFTQSSKAYSIAEINYKAGEIDLLDALQIQQQAISAESNLLVIKRAQLEQRIDLYLSLGGGW